MSNINIKIEGIEKLQAALKKFPAEIQRTIEAAGEEAAKEILKEEGLQKYPPATDANRPGRTKEVTFPSTGRTATFRMPYYERGKGTWRPVRGGGWQLDATSRNLGKQWHVESQGLTTKIGNSAPYAKYVVGDKQPEHMIQKGWKQLYPVAQSKLKVITGIYQRWINRIIEKLKL